VHLIGKVFGRLAMFAGAVLAVYAGVVLAAGTFAAVSGTSAQPPGATADVRNAKNNRALFVRGRQIFRHDTFGDEVFWGGALQLHRAIAGARNGGVGPGVSPKTALAVGLKVDSAAVPAPTAAAIKAGNVNLDDPGVTLALLKLNAVVGVKGSFNRSGRLISMGITCALCHSTVDDSFAPGIGRRLDGWPNRDLNPGAIIALSPVLPADKKAVYQSWGPGKYDPRYNQDGKNTPLVLPPAYGLAQITNETYTAEGPISYWNAYVAVTQMGGQGNFSDPRLGIDVKHTPDLVTPKLAALRAYQHSLAAPPAPAGSFDATAATRGRAVFDRACASCHVGVSGTDNNMGALHPPADTGVDGAYAARTANKAYRTTPLRALWQHPPYFHDGSAATLADVVAHYNRVRKLNLTADQQRDLVEFLKSR
jgi:mono/diheme cytochrome c family protein